MLWTIIVMVLVGLVAGFVARAVVPGDDSMGIGATIVLGLVGSLIGGFLGWLIFGSDWDDGAFQFSGLIGSIIGAIIALLVWRAVDRRGGTRAGSGRSRVGV